MKKGVHSKHSALKYDSTLAGAAVKVEMDKLARYEALQIIDFKDLPPKAIVLASFLLYKLKTDAITGEVTD